MVPSGVILLFEPSKILKLGWIAIFINVLLMVVKVVVGWVGNSYALIADGIESASDIVTSMITWVGFRVSLRPPDLTHPFGHGKVESLAGFVSGVALLLAAGLIAHFSILEIRTPHHAPEWFTLPVLLLVVVVKELLSRKVLQAGKELGSQALSGDGWHHRSDAITSAAAALGIAIALVGGPGYESADDWGALAACVVIVVNGFRISRASLHDMLDGNAVDAPVERIIELAGATEGVCTIEKCRVRKSGIGYFVELHVEVDPEMTVRAGHDVGHLVKSRLLAEAQLRILDVVIHLEPHSGS